MRLPSRPSMGNAAHPAPSTVGSVRGTPRPGRSRRRAVLASLVAAGSLGLAAPVGAESHVVQPGETLSEIAARHGLTSSRLQEANRLVDPHQIVAGRVLTIPAPGTAPASAAAVTSHTVESGETLSHIAQRYGVSAQALAQANAITDPHHVRQGQVLSLAGAPAGAPAAAARSHRVQAGDSLSALAHRAGTTTAEVLRLNGLTDPNHIRIGQVLQLPAGKTTTNAPTGTIRPSSVTGRYPNLPAKLIAHPERLELMPRFERWAAHYGVPVEVLMGVTWLESGWQNHMVSHAGAVGIGQLMPITSRWLADEIIGVPALDPQVPDDNIRMSAAFLAWLQRAMGTRDLALAAYYQGPTSVRALGAFPVTDVYVTTANALIPRFRPA